MRLPVIIAALTVLSARAQDAPPPSPTDKPASVEGSVVNAVTGEPLLRAHVTLRAFDGQRTYGALTGPDGKFSVTAMPAGNYSASAERVGFVSDGVAEPIRLSAGQTSTELKLKLIPSGAITGRVTDPDGEPVKSVNVAAIINGESRNATSTDEKGGFRLGNLTPGKYRILVKPQMTSFPPEIRSDGTEEVHFRRTYYPNVPDEHAAAQVEVTAGNETGGIDIRLLRGVIVGVKGVVMGLPPGTQHANLLVQSGPGFENGGMVKPDGTFQIWRLDPGKYRLTARASDSARSPLQSAPVEIEVGNSNLENVELRIVPASDIQGQIVYDDDQAKPPPPGQSAPSATSATSATSGGPQSAQVTNPAQARRVFLQGLPGFISMGAGSATISADGSFTLERVQPDVYTIHLSWNGAYVKSISLGQTQADGSTVDLRNGSGGQTLSVRISSAVAQLSGTVHDGDKPAAGVQVVLAPDGAGPGVVRLVQTDGNGAYTLIGLSPGKYRILAAKSTGGQFFVRGKLSEEYDDRTDTVELAPNDQATRDLKLQ